MKPGPDHHRLRAAAGVVGELLITLGVVLLLLVVYELYWTNYLSAAKQHDATSALNKQWADNPVVGKPGVGPTQPIDGKGFAKLYVPSFGADYHFTMLEGTTPAVIDAGPGHYVGTALPGGLGNFAVAGHRVGRGAPFLALGELHSCDSIVVETARSWFVYRVLPMAGETTNWASTGGQSPRCTDSPIAVTPPPSRITRRPQSLRPTSWRCSPSPLATRSSRLASG